MVRHEKPRFSASSTDWIRTARYYLPEPCTTDSMAEKQGFERLVDMLAVWPVGLVVSAAPFYYAPTREVFVKPNTVKGMAST